MGAKVTCANQKFNIIARISASTTESSIETIELVRNTIVENPEIIEARDENNNPIGFTFRFLSDHDDYEKIFKKWELFGSWLNTHLGFRQHDLGFDFASAAISVNEDIAFISSDYVEKNKVDILKKFEQIFVNQNFFLVPSLAEEVTSDLDTYILPIAPKTWILPDYPQNSLQYESTKYALNILNDLKHTVHLVPGLHRIKHEDIDAIPNYANSLLINKLAFVPAYALKSDEIIQGILKDYGYKVIPIDCRRIISSSAALHCITKTIPKVI